MKKKTLFGVVGALTALILVLAGCPTEADDSPPSGKIGEKTLTLKGTVYTLNGTTYTNAATAYDGAVAGAPDGTGEIDKGKLEFSVEPLANAALTLPFNEAAVNVLLDGVLYTDITIAPADATYAVLNLLPAKGATLEPYNTSVSDTAIKSEYVTYLYLSKAVKITGTKSSTFDLGQPSKLNISLVKGWNILYRKHEVKTSGQSTSIKVEKHNLKWVVIP
ncbi:MAG: hypothetical protein LBS37_01100 [Treponema sp.]|jgi:hypothetical protein|nr:hypothetical protein [Treponema sp.]